jgi:hypothetical protein
MVNRNRTTFLVAVLLASATMTRSAAAQDLRAPLFPPATQTVFRLTNQPLFGENVQPPQPQQQQQRGSKDPEFGFGFGIKGGPLFASVNTTSFSFENKTGFLVGIWFGGNRTGTVGVEGEVMYGKKGAPVTSGTGNVDLYFIEIPILFRVNVGTQSINKWVVYGIAGPAFDIKLKGKQNDLDVSDNYAGLDIGVIAGGGFEILRFLIEARGKWGQRNLNNLANSVEIKDKSFVLLFGVRLN